ncbi:MAG: methylamine utilization protein [Gammaproteobacteria bacterium]
MNFSRVLLILLAMHPALAAAGELRVSVHDADGKPLDQAVVVVDTGQRGAAPEGGVVIDQVNRMFVPHVSVIPTGTAVSFPNRDDIRHHLYSFSAAKTFELSLYKGTPAEPVVFDQAGIVTLACNIHDWMLGFVYVTDHAASTVTGEDGIAQFTVPDRAHYRVTVWHPTLGPDTEGIVRDVLHADSADIGVVVAAAADPERGSRRLRRGAGKYR